MTDKWIDNDNNDFKTNRAKVSQETIVTYVDDSVANVSEELSRGRQLTSLNMFSVLFRWPNNIQNDTLEMR